MSVPKSVVKYKKGQVTFTSNVDRASYTMKELARAALRDVGKFICRGAKKKIKKRTGRGAKNIQYWVRSKQRIPNLQVGIKPGGFYIGFQELGTSKTPRIGALADTTMEGIETIRDIEARYLSYIEDEQQALRVIEEGEEIGE